MNDTRSRIVMSLFAFIPYLLVSWAYTAFVDGDAGDWGTAFALLVGARLFFSLIETLGSVISWRLYGKSFMVNKFLAFLRANSFPKREYSHDDFLSYLTGIQDGPYAASLKASAREIYFILSTFESMGILLGARMHSATEAALDEYSPKSEARIVGANAA